MRSSGRTLTRPETLRYLTIGLGLGTLAIGVPPLIAPRWFARLAGLPLADSPAGEVVIRSVSIRDAVSGIGILSATLHGGRVAPWLLARTLADGTDALAIALAVRRGARDPRLIGLGVVALGATILDVILYLAHKSVGRAPRPTSSASAG